MEEKMSEQPHEECLELKNIKYKSMLLNGSVLKETKNANNLNSWIVSWKMKKIIM